MQLSWRLYRRRDFTPTEKVIYLQITDLHGNALPGGTKVAAATTNGKVVLAPVSPLPDNTDCVLRDPQFGSTAQTGPDAFWTAAPLTA